MSIQPLTSARAASPGVPFVRLDNADPALLEELLGVVRDVASEAAFSMGRHLDQFEVDFASYCEVEHAIGVSSGTEALALALRALGVGVGDEVVVPANSFVATAEAVSAVGATPRFVDVDAETHLLTAELLERAIGPTVRAVIPVHLYGATVDLDPIMEVTRASGIAVVEDACQAHGAWYRGRRVGTIGDAGCFSFYPTKNLGAWGDGGAVVTNDRAVADTVRLLRSHGERPRYHHLTIGTTARLDALQAALLRVKLARLDQWNDQRRVNASRLLHALEGADVALPHAPSPGVDHVYHLFVVRSEDRDSLREHLTAHGVASAVHYPVPIHRTQAYAHLGYDEGSLPVVEHTAARICSLPMFPGMSDAEVEAIAAVIRTWQGPEAP